MLDHQRNHVNLSALMTLRLGLALSLENKEVSRKKKTYEIKMRLTLFELTNISGK